MIQDVAIVDDLLSADAMRSLLAAIVEREDEFVASRVLREDSDHDGLVDPRLRLNLHLKGADAIPAGVLAAIKAAAPGMCRDLGMEATCLATARFESEITATTDGGFFRAHIDNGHERVGDRLLTYVYFFGETPRPFRGGELCVERDWRSGDRIYFLDASPGDVGLPAEVVQVVEPIPNRLVMFRGDRMHEVRSVATEAERFGASRFTITGWVRTRVADDATGADVAATKVVG